MNIHKNARLTLARRMELVRSMLDGLGAAEAAAMQGVSSSTAGRWLGRYLAEGQAGLVDHSSRPWRSPRSISPGKALLIVELRHRRLTQARIAKSVGVAIATVSRVLARAGISRLSDLEPAPPVVRYEHAHPGDLLHIDTKKLGRIDRLGHRITGERRGRTGVAGWGYLFGAVDDHARIAFTQIRKCERGADAVAFLGAALRHYESLGVTVTQVLTGNGRGVRNKRFAKASNAWACATPSRDLTGPKPTA